MRKLPISQLFIFVYLLFGEVLAQENQTIHIIPEPQKIDYHKGNFTIKNNTSIFIDGFNKEDLEYSISILRESLNLKGGLPVSSKNSSIFLVRDKSNLMKDESYSLNIDSSGIKIIASSISGILYGCQSLRQIIPLSLKKGDLRSVNLPFLKISDYPRFKWRGYMKDVSRTFYSVDFIKKYLDVMSLYKLNTFHFHLTDDQGWRIEIKKYPKLTSDKTTVFPEEFNQPRKRSGYYTQDDIKELVAYAKQRNITIVPEIDVPGHCWPIILARPDLGSNNNTNPQYVFPFLESWKHWGHQFTPNPLDPTNEQVYSFLDDVFSEISLLFPGDYIHFGGDEVVHKLWEKETHIKRFMDNNNMSKVEELQSYFVNKVVDIITKKGKKPLGWNDILADVNNLSKNTAIMSWLGSDAVEKAVNNNLYAVATPTSPLYFDITQQSRDDGTMSDLNYGAINSLERVYQYNPTEGIAEDKIKYVLGVQANMWPAVPQETNDVNVQNFPRLLALSEIAWTNLENKDFNKFDHKLDYHYPRLDALGIEYFKDGGYIVGKWNPNILSSDTSIIDIDVTKHTIGNGRISVGFFYTKGNDFLEIKSVELLKNGKVVAEDSHISIADKFRGIPYKKNMFLYNFTLPVYDKKSSYKIRAKVSGKEGKDSFGNITYNLSKD